MPALIDRVWRRHRQRPATFARDDIAATWQVCSLLLDYPSDNLLARVPELRRVAEQLPGALGQPLVDFLAGIGTLELLDLQRDYVETFDVTRKCALHLTYATCGDTRRRGVALVQFKQAFRASGVELDDPDAELPDYLPIVLEFGALTDYETGWTLLTGHRVSIELLHRALRHRASQWLPVVEALRATLPVLDGTDEEALAALIAAGPPTEDVGLDGGQDPYGSNPASAHFDPTAAFASAPSMSGARSGAGAISGSGEDLAGAADALDHLLNGGPTRTQLPIVSVSEASLPTPAGAQR